MIELTEQERLALEAGGEPPTLVDAKTQTVYVLLQKDLYDRMRLLLEEDEQERKLEAGWQKLTFQGLALALDDEP